MDRSNLDKRRFRDFTFKLTLTPDNAKRLVEERFRFGNDFFIEDIDITARYVAVVGGQKRDVYINELTTNRDPLKLKITGSGKYEWMAKDATDIFSLSKLSAKTGPLGIQCEDMELTVTLTHEPIDPAQPHFNDIIIVEITFYGFEYEKDGSQN
jgi:hypothetical protein